MKRIVKLLAVCFLIVIIPIVGNTTFSEKAGTDAEDSEVTYRLFAGEKEIKAEDTYFNKQWALKNDGGMQYQINVSSFSSLMDDIFDDFFNDPFFSDPFFNDPFFGGGFFGDWDFLFPFENRFTSMASTSNKTTVADVDIDMDKAWGVYNGGKREVIVAVIDTGIDITHEDLEGRIWVNEDEIPNDGIDNDGNGYIDDINGWNFYENNNKLYSGSNDAHGTHGAGTIAANLNRIGVAGICGSSPVKIMVLKALGGSNGEGTTDAVVKAIRYAEDKGAVICNLSFGTGLYDGPLLKAMQESSMLFVCAAGNGDSQNRGYSIEDRPIYPGSYELDNIITVSNIEGDGELSATSNYGKKSVDIAAPGTYILSTTAGSKYSYMTGTSMAAPMVTGVAALVYSASDDLSVIDVKNIILESAKKMSSLKGKVLSGGMLNAYDALLLAKEIELEKTAPVISVIDSKHGYFMINADDPEGDITMVRVLRGSRKVSDFKDGKAGKTVNIMKDGRALFKGIDGEDYTFYVRDSKGNEDICRSADR